jgi:flavin-dependent dehydrogenase
VDTVLIRGGGIAACCCTHLLRQGGIPLVVERVDRPRLPAIMVSHATQKLLSDVFQRGDLFHGLHQIRRRIVLWGGNSRPVAVSHSALVVSEQVLLDRLRPEAAPGDSQQFGGSAWTILTSYPLPPSSVERAFGSRMATACAIRLKAGSDAAACWIESLDDGWLFLLPVDRENAWLLAVGGAAQSLLARSRLVVEEIAQATGTGGTFSCHPRIADPLAGAGWLVCGTAGLGFDPLCGEGAGHATREAILGSAVARAAAEGADVDSVIAHYQNRLLAGFRKHLEVCRDFYQAGGSGPWWDQQIEEIRRGLEWSTGRLQESGPFRYRLNGFALEPVG